MADSEQFYSGKVILTADYSDTQLDFGFESDHLMIANDGTGELTFSFNGQTGTNDGDISALDRSAAFDGMAKSKIFVKTDNPGDQARIWAWKDKS